LSPRPAAPVSSGSDIRRFFASLGSGSFGPVHPDSGALENLKKSKFTSTGIGSTVYLTHLVAFLDVLVSHINIWQVLRITVINKKLNKKSISLLKLKVKTLSPTSLLYNFAVKSWLFLISWKKKKII
jgi:hypothetical protein